MTNRAVPRRMPRRRLTCLLAAAAATLTFAGPAQASISPLVASMENGSFSEFSQTGILGGTLGVQAGSGYDGTHSALATYKGGSGNGYARAIENVSWSGTQDVWYGGAYMLPTGYAANVQGGNDLMRWDNWGTYGSAADYGGVEMWSDGKARVMLGKYTNDPGTVLAGPFTLPEGRWFWMEVHQHFSTGAGALTDVYIDGTLVAHSTAPNNYGRGADRVRWGIVCIDAGRQTKSLSLSFDRASIQSTQLGVPVRSTPPPPPAGVQSMETGDFSEFSQTGVLGGSLSVQAGDGYDGTHSALATYQGGSGNGYARAIQNISWSGTQDVWYGGAFKLPTGYAASLQGGNDIMRWDNYGTYASGADYGGVEMWSDGKARIMLGKYTNDPGTVLAGPFTLPEGRWFWMEVHQHFSTGAGALTDVYIDGTLVAHSTAPNNYGRGADRVRWGIVSIDAGRQTKSLSLSFDRTSIQSSQLGPLPH